MPPLLCPDSFHDTEVVPISPNHLEAPEACRVGRFRLFYDYLQIGTDNAVQCRFEHELVGVTVISGVESGVISVTTGQARREYSLWDTSCFYDRFNSVIFTEPIPAGAPVRIQLTDLPIDYSLARRPIDHPVEKNLKIIGFLLRKLERPHA